jgi:hypothetical protein
MAKAIEEILAPKPEARPRIYAYSIDAAAHAGLRTLLHRPSTAMYRGRLDRDGCDAYNGSIDIIAQGGMYGQPDHSQP